MKQTSLIAEHRTAGAKLVDFAGWEMPIQYSGVVDEYHTVRTKAGLFDVSHMGRIVVSGPSAGQFLQSITTNDVAALPPWGAQYSMICNHQGGIKDDIFVYALGDSNEYLVCVNASNREKILSWMQEQHRHFPECRLQDQSAQVAQIALQGPASRAIVSAMGLSTLEEMKVRKSAKVIIDEVPCLVARTGYTGEFGYELYVFGTPAPVWNSLLETGRTFDIKPAGLGARDLLRLDMGYLLYGNDINEDTTPLEAGVEWAVSFTKGEFIGREALWSQKQSGPTRRLIAFELLEKGVPRHGFTILDAAASTSIGQVTSGNLSPMLQKGIGMGYVRSSYSSPGTTITVDIRGKAFPAMIVKPPFYKKPVRSKE
ncbi:MAG: glycine cleavage system aminomethyltransferase GcvT [Nitrospira sp.]|nr:glycine cleavage system aminomethyltransferase GcvT [Nitrospira sp.]